MKKFEYSPLVGTKMLPTDPGRDPMYWRRSFSGAPWTFNPYTGKRRDPRDILSDPEGWAIVPPCAEHRLMAAMVEQVQPFAQSMCEAASAAVASAKPMVLPADAKVRKELVITTGVLDYFPLALAEVARASKAGNDQHNPGKPLHWDKTKSMDHADCIPRHLIDRGTRDTDGVRHSAKLAWRALALLQIELENEAKEQA